MQMKMKKTNKISIIVSVMLLVVIAIIPLCSFTGSLSGARFVWTSLHDIAVGYEYYNGGVSSPYTLYGTIEKFNRCFALSDLDFNFNDVEFQSDGYNILSSNPSLKINYSKSSSSYNSSTGVLAMNMVTSGGNATRTLQFDGTVRIDGFINDSNIRNYKVYFPNVDPGVSNGYACYVRCNYVYREGDNLFTNVYYSPQLQPVWDRFTGVDLSSVYTELIRFMRSDGIVPLYLSSMDITFYIIGSGLQERIYTDSITVSAPIMPDGAKFAYVVDSVRAYWYDVGYGAGYNLGLSSASDVWGSLGDYLVNSVGSFFDMEFVQGVSFGDLVSFILGFVLVMVFLKIFAGG